jgi:hypothetical protein
MTQVISASGLNCSRARSLNKEVAAACIFALISYSLQARWSKQGNKNVPTSPSLAGVKQSSSDNKWLLADRLGRISRPYAWIKSENAARRIGREYNPKMPKIPTSIGGPLLFFFF